MRESRFVAFFSALAFVGYVQVVWQLPNKPSLRAESVTAVVMPATLQVALYGGDRFLAAGIEAIRATMSGGGLRLNEAVFRMRAHDVAGQLNSCHEDNYWIGNAEMTWGGSHRVGLELLKRASNCRFWDEWPPFFYGFSQQFFNHDIEEARRALELAASRASEKNAAAYRNLSVMLAAGQFEDASLALGMVRRERDRATDPRLRELLTLRVGRLEGLVELRRAQKMYEAKIGRPLLEAQQLIKSGVLASFPKDPLGLGYELENGTFQLKVLRNEGLEGLR